MNLRHHKTAKGTELPLLNLRGKEYLEVKYRLVWFREEHPDWSIETDLISVTDVSASAKATVKDEQGRVIATSHKYESIKGFPDFIEKAETGSIGRALALIGYGTQFCADELDDGKRVAPAKTISARGPQTVEDGVLPEDQPKAEAPEPGEYLISFGRKYKGKKLSEIPKTEVESYLGWLITSANKQGNGVSPQVESLRQAYHRMYPVEPRASH